MSENITMRILKLFNDSDVILTDLLPSIFSKSEREVIENLLDKGLLKKQTTDEAVNGVSLDEKMKNRELYRITQSGRLEVFKDRNSERIRSFRNVLTSLRYEESLLDEFLMTQDLNRPIDSILDIPRFHAFYQSRIAIEFESDSYKEMK